MAQRVEALAAKVSEYLPATPERALLHGDLWGGNYMIDERGEPVLIDPAVYYGHREADLAMTMLFGGFDKTSYNLGQLKSHSDVDD